MSNLQNGGGLNGSFVLKKGQTVLADSARDVLFGLAPLSWAFADDEDLALLV